MESVSLLIMKIILDKFFLWNISLWNRSHIQEHLRPNRINFLKYEKKKIKTPLILVVAVSKHTHYLTFAFTFYLPPTECKYLNFLSDRILRLLGDIFSPQFYLILTFEIKLRIKNVVVLHQTLPLIRLRLNAPSC